MKLLFGLHGLDRKTLYEHSYLKKIYGLFSTLYPGTYVHLNQYNTNIAKEYKLSWERTGWNLVWLVWVLK